VSDALLDAAQVLREVTRRYRSDPLAFERPTPPQEDFHSDPSRRKQLRGPNQGGKTRAGVRELLWRMDGHHPYIEVRPPPSHFWVVCHSWKQSLTVQRKIHELLPRHLVDWTTTSFSYKNGFSGQFLQFQNRSTAAIVTTGQGSLALASATLDGIWCDEPPPEHLWGELNARLLARQGDLWLTLTPIGRPVEWLKEKCEGSEADPAQISDRQFSLTVENCTPIGSRRPFLSQANIDDITRSYLPFERAQRLEGAWEGVSEGRVFEAWDPDRMVTTKNPEGQVKLGVGIDHGGGVGRQAAVLVAVRRQAEGRGRIWVLDESVSDGMTTPEDDARAILAMLDRNGVPFAAVDVWRGDRPYSGRRGVGSKSNQMLERVFRRLLKSPRLPCRIRTPKKFQGSVEYGSRVIHALMLHRDFWVTADCVYLVDALSHWDGGEPYKDVVDALRYITVDMLSSRPFNPGKLRLYR